MPRQMMKPVASCTNIIPMMAGEVKRSTKAMPLRGPILSQTTPIRKRQTMFDVTAAVLPSVLDFLSVGASGAGAKVEKNVVKKPNHAAWNACMCGFLKLLILSSEALCSASTLTWNLRPLMSHGAGSLSVMAHWRRGREPRVG